MGSYGSDSGGRGGTNGLRQALPYLAVVLVYGLFLGFYNNMYSYRQYDALKFDLLSEADNPSLAKSPGLYARQMHRVGEGDEMLLMLDEQNAALPFTVERAQALSLKIKAYMQRSEHSKPDVDLLINGETTATLKPAWEGAIEEHTVDIPALALREGENTLELRPLVPDSRTIGIESLDVKNYSGMNKNFPRSFVIADENHERGGFSPVRSPTDYLLFPAIVLLLWLVSANIAASGKAPLTRTLRRAITINIPVASLLLLAAVYSMATGSEVICEYRTVLILVALPSFFYVIYHLVMMVLSGRATSRITGGLGRIEGLMQRSRAAASKDNRERVAGAVGFVARNAATTAIVAFIICLSIAGLLLIVKNQNAAERMADIAYFALVIGVLLRIFDLRHAE